MTVATRPVGRAALSCPPTGARPQPRPADKNDVVRPTNLELWKETGLTAFMVIHTTSPKASDSASVAGIRQDPPRPPHAPQAYGARITYDIPLNEGRRVEERFKMTKAGLCNYFHEQSPCSPGRLPLVMWGRSRQRQCRSRAGNEVYIDFFLEGGTSIFP